MYGKEEQAWLRLHNELGESLLDVERTFMNVVDRDAPRASNSSAAVHAYLHAWNRLFAAHHDLSTFLLKPLPTARLLLVDDDISALQVMNSILSEYPDKRFATSAEEALRLVREQTPDLILLDVIMPDMTGFEMFSALKQDVALADIPVVFVSAHDIESLREAGAPMGASAFISKPMVGAQLQAAVTHSLGALA